MAKKNNGIGEEEHEKTNFKHCADPVHYADDIACACTCSLNVDS